MAKAAKQKGKKCLSAKVSEDRIAKMLALREYWLENINNAHVIVQGGNMKTGDGATTASIIPIVDCINCSGCCSECYDMRNDCWRPDVMNDRARNSAIHMADKERYWWEVEKGIKEKFSVFHRQNVGGDMDNDDIEFIGNLGRHLPRTTFQFFTKNYTGVNSYYDKGNSFPNTIKCLFSRWPGMECQNPYGFPEAHVMWGDGSTTAPNMAYLCKGNCSHCYFYEEGCPSLEKNEHVVMLAH